MTEREILQVGQKAGRTMRHRRHMQHSTEQGKKLHLTILDVSAHIVTQDSTVQKQTYFGLRHAVFETQFSVYVRHRNFRK